MSLCRKRHLEFGRPGKGAFRSARRRKGARPPRILPCYIKQGAEREDGQYCVAHGFLVLAPDGLACVKMQVLPSESGKKTRSA